MSRTMDLNRRREIALAALDVLRRQGLQQVTMASLAKALGLKRPTLYFYFPSVPDLLAALFEILREDEAAYVAARIAGVGHPIDGLAAFLRAEHAFASERGLDDVIVLMASFWASGGPEDRVRFRQLVLKELLPTRALFIQLLRGGQSAGLVADCDVEALVDTIFALQDGVLLQGSVRDLDVDRVFTLIEQRLLEPLRR